MEWQEAMAKYRDSVASEPMGRSQRTAGPEPRRGLTLGEMCARQARVEMEIRQEKLSAELAHDRTLIAAANARPISWNHARSFHAGAPWPGADASPAEHIGWRLYRKGWLKPADIPSVWR